MAWPAEPMKAPTDEIMMTRPRCRRSILARARLATRNDRGEIGVDHLGPGVLAHAQHQGVPGDPGVGHQDLDRPPGLLDGGEGRLDLVGVGHVAGQRQEAVRPGAERRARRPRSAR